MYLCKLSKKDGQMTVRGSAVCFFCIVTVLINIARSQLSGIIEYNINSGEGTTGCVQELAVLV